MSEVATKRSVSDHIAQPSMRLSAKDANSAGKALPARINKRTHFPPVEQLLARCDRMTRKLTAV